MQVLFLEGGYKFLDVRSDREHGFGAIRGSTLVPYTKDKKTWVDGKMKIEKTKVDGWIKNVNAKIPKKDTKLIVHDMMGKQVIIVRHARQGVYRYIIYGMVIIVMSILMVLVAFKQAIECLELLFEDGYENIVGMKGGFKPWFKTFGESRSSP